MIFKSRRVLVSEPQEALLLKRIKTAQKGGSGDMARLAGVKCARGLVEIGRLPMVG